MTKSGVRRGTSKTTDSGVLQDEVTNEYLSDIASDTLKFKLGTVVMALVGNITSPHNPVIKVLSVLGILIVLFYKEDKYDH